MVVSTLDVLRPIQEMRGHVLCFRVTESTPVYAIFLLDFTTVQKSCINFGSKPDFEIITSISVQYIYIWINIV